MSHADKITEKKALKCSVHMKKKIEKMFPRRMFFKTFKRCQQHLNASEVSSQTAVSGKVAGYKFKWTEQEGECSKSLSGEKRLSTLCLGV